MGSFAITISLNYYSDSLWYPVGVNKDLCETQHLSITKHHLFFFKKDNYKGNYQLSFADKIIKTTKQ